MVLDVRYYSTIENLYNCLIECQKRLITSQEFNELDGVKC